MSDGAWPNALSCAVTRVGLTAQVVSVNKKGKHGFKYLFNYVRMKMVDERDTNSALPLFLGQHIFGHLG